VPYEGEFAGYRPLQRIVETERVQQLLRRSRVYQPNQANGGAVVPQPAPTVTEPLPGYVVAIDGSNAEVDVKNGYPGAKIGYCTVASVLLNLSEMARLDQQRPVDPAEFRKTEEASTVDAALPGSNVITRTNPSARDSFRESLYEVLHDVVVDQDDGSRLLDTYEALLKLKPQLRGQTCPYQADGCVEHLVVPVGVSSCTCSKKLPIYSTDALRVHERFRDIGTNGEAFGEVRQVWERILMVHVLRLFERQKLLNRMDRLAFVLDGPLALFGHPAWLSAAISTELKRLNTIVRAETGRDMLILGIEKSGEFVTHFEELDKGEDGAPNFQPRTYFLPTDRYIKERVVFSISDKRYGMDTYFGRKFLYKTASCARIVANIPFLDEAQDTLDSNDISLYPEFGTSCALLDILASSRFPNAVSPLISAHAQAAIPLHLGTRVLQQLAKALMRQD
jgi:hypothetical protein